MTPNLTSDHHFLFSPIPLNWIKRAKEIRAKEDSISGEQRFLSDGRWAGKVGEWAFYTVYPHMEPVTSDYQAKDYDFISNKTDLRYDPKLDYSGIPFKDNLRALVDARQVEKDSADIFVFLYWYSATLTVRLCGWIYSRMVKTRGFPLSKGDAYPGPAKTVRNDCWIIPYKELNSMHLMPDLPQRPS